MSSWKLISLRLVSWVRSINIPVLSAGHNLWCSSLKNPIVLPTATCVQLNVPSSWPRLISCTVVLSRRKTAPYQPTFLSSAFILCWLWVNVSILWKSWHPTPLLTGHFEFLHRTIMTSVLQELLLNITFHIQFPPLSSLLLLFFTPGLLFPSPQVPRSF